MKITDLIYPENLYCLCCGDTMQQNRIHGICDSCASKIHWLYENPYKSIMDEFSFSDVISCCRYGFFERKIMNALKTGGKPYTAKGPALLMAERDKFSGKQFDLIVPVPIHKNKLAKRGYNQAELLADVISKELGIPSVNALLKITETKSMRSSGGMERRLLLDGSFAADPECRELMRSKRILLVDDVVTTGSTADSCSRVLLAEGAAEVSVLCFASASS